MRRVVLAIPDRDLGAIKSGPGVGPVWAVDVWKSPCGGPRKVTDIVTSRRTAEEILRNFGLLRAPPQRPVALAQAPPHLRLPMT